MRTFRDIEELCKQELEEELIEERKEILKERLRELKEAKKAISALEKQYKELLEEEI